MGDHRGDYRAITAEIVARGFRVIEGFSKGGFWVRNQDMTRPDFVDERSFISFASAKAIFAAGATKGG